MALKKEPDASLVQLSVATQLLIKFSLKKDPVATLLLLEDVMATQLLEKDLVATTHTTMVSSHATKAQSI